MDERQSQNRNANPNATGEWRVDPRDVQLHKRRLKEAQRVGPLGKLFRASAAVVLLAAAVGVYLNWDTLRGLRVSFDGLTSAFERATGGADVSGAAGNLEPAIVEAPSVVGDALPSSIDGEPTAAPEAAPEPAVPTPASDVGARPAAPPESVAALPPPAPEPPPEPEGPETFEFGLDTVTVSEADASAAVLVLRSGGRRAPTAVTWWTTNDTATAGSDFASLGRQVLRFAASEQNRSIRVPIIGDRAAEGPEIFVVHIAPGDDTGAPREAVARVEIIIADDD